MREAALYHRQDQVLHTTDLLELVVVTKIKTKEQKGKTPDARVLKGLERTRQPRHFWAPVQCFVSLMYAQLLDVSAVGLHQRDGLKPENTPSGFFFAGFSNRFSFKKKNR
jgi:hypothetical protein